MKTKLVAVRKRVAQAGGRSFRGRDIAALVAAVRQHPRAPVRSVREGELQAKLEAVRKQLPRR